MKIPSSADDLMLSVTMKAPSEPKAIVQIVHGMCEHKERYYEFMDYLVECGFVCIIHDNRGHGESIKKADDLGYMYDGGWKALVDDVKVVNDYVKSQFPGLKCILFGHSMGSLIVRSYVKRYDDTIDKLFVCGSPSYNPGSIAAKWICKLIMMCGGEHSRPQLIQKLAFLGYNKAFKSDGYPVAWVCSDKEILEKYHHDPLCMYTFTANGFYNLFCLMQDCYSSTGWQVKNKEMTVHFISGHEDPCRTSDKDFNNAVNAIKKHYKCDSLLFERMRHEVLNETDKQVVWEYVRARI